MKHRTLKISIAVLLTAIVTYGCGNSKKEKLDNALCAYDDMISFIVQGYQAHWDFETKPETYGLSDVYCYESPHAGFCKTDINGDGIEDLILGENFEDGPTVIYDIMTIDTDTWELAHLASGGERDRYYLAFRDNYCGGCRNNDSGEGSCLVLEEGSSSAEDSFTKTFEVGKKSLTPFECKDCKGREINVRDCRRLALDFFKSYAREDNGELWRNQQAPIADRVEDLLGRLSADEKMNVLLALSAPIERLDIKKYYHGNEALHGIVRPGRFTVFPQAIGLAAMWDPELHYQIATAASDEARARWNELGEGEFQNAEFSDLLTFWSPTINMARDPRWGRTPETYGEDPYLTGVLGSAFVKGLQGNDPRYLKVVSTPKHFACNNEEHNRMSCNAVISEKQLREYYLPGYEMCVKEAKCQSIMASYNAINGMPNCCNKWLLTDVLRGDWGFDGYVVSDCAGVGALYDWHHFVPDKKVAATLALKAGLDLECGEDAFLQPLHDAYSEGMVTDEDLDRAARRVLTARMKLGLFDNNIDNPYAHIDPSVVGCRKHRELALKAARESIVLLKNNGILPLDSMKLNSVAVVGNNAAKCELGDYSGIPTIAPVSVLTAVTEKLGANKVKYVPWRSKAEETDMVESKYFADGIMVEYYEDQDFTQLRSSRKESSVWYEPAGKAPDPDVPIFDVSVRWTGKLKPEVSGEYKFKLDVRGWAEWWFDGKSVKGNELTTRLEAGREYDIKVEHSHGRDSDILVALRWKKPDSQNDDIFREACETAAASDAVIAVMGINKNYEREGRDRDYLELPPEQVEFLQRIYAANQNVILVIVAGSSMAVNWENDNLPAILDAWYGGEYGGTAIADVLFGDVNPSGRLPLTFYKSMDQLPPFDDYDIAKGRTYQYFKGEPLYPFGYGLSYTAFEYDNLRVNSRDEGVEVSFKVKNIGKRDGDEVAQVYVSLNDYDGPEGSAPIKELKGFKRIHLKQGKSETVKITIPWEQLRWWSDSEKRFVTTSVLPKVYVGASSQDIRIQL